MSRTRDTCRTKPKLASLGALGLIAAAWLVGCGDYAGSGSSQPGPSARAITREDPSGVVAGLVFKQPVSLDEARSLGRELAGDLIAVYRTDYAAVQPITNGMPDWEPEPSRFAYVDAGQIQEGRLAAIEAGDAPPITGFHISASYWEHWEDQWRHAQEPGVRFEAVALYLRESSLAAARSDPRFRAVEIIPHRYLPDYREVVLESEGFPPGRLSEPPPKPPDSSALSPEEIEALIAKLKAESSDISWAELMRGEKQLGTRKVVGVLTDEGRIEAVGFDLSVDGNPKHRLQSLFLPPENSEGEDPRYESLPRRSPLDVHPGTIAVWGYPTGPAVRASDGETEIYEGFHVIYMEYQ